MIKISVSCSRPGCPVWEPIPTMDQRKLKKYLQDRLWIVAKGNAFCGELCEFTFNEDEKFKKKRKTLTFKKK